MSILVTGAAGFIGAHVAQALIARGETVFGIDNLNTYYDVSLKRARLAALVDGAGFSFVEGDISDRSVMERLRGERAIKQVVHLAAQAGVRYSLDNPRSYAESNLVGHTEVLELGRALNTEHIVYASSSSVYGANTSIPFKEADRTDAPVSFYGATKKACEALSASYAHLYGLPLTGLRFFTVYGPWGRPDMAYMIFARKILAGEPIDVYGDGDMGRDFTYIDDVVAGILAALNHPPTTDDGARHQLFNIGNDRPERLADLISTLEGRLGMKAEQNLLPMQPGDVRETWADISKARSTLGYNPKVSLDQGIEHFVRWYKDHFAA
ncbi:MAG: NAD-dependent epimerase/dehydratase family protein [Pseudomonadota bacterium]